MPIIATLNASTLNVQLGTLY